MPLLQWLRRFRKGKKAESEKKYDFPMVTAGPQEAYVSRQEYEGLIEQFNILREQIKVSQEPLERLDFPEAVMERLPPEVQETIHGIIFNFEHDFPDFCFLGMRKALIDAIRIRFQMDRKISRLYKADGNAYELGRWIDLAREEKYVSKQIADSVKGQVKVFGDAASHDYMTDLQKEEVRPVFTSLRMALSRMYYPEKST